MSKQIWNCQPWNSGYFETVCPGQPENLQNCLSKHKVNIFRAMSTNIINSKKLPVLYFLWSKMQKGFNTYFLHLFGPKLSITSKNFWNCLWVCLGSETVYPEKDKQTAFYSPLPRTERQQKWLVTTSYHSSQQNKETELTTVDSQNELNMFHITFEFFLCCNILVSASFGVGNHFLGLRY